MLLKEDVEINYYIFNSTSKDIGAKVLPQLHTETFSILYPSDI